MSAQSSYDQIVARLEREQLDLIDKQKHCKHENVGVAIFDDEEIDGTLIDGIDYERCLDCDLERI